MPKIKEYVENVKEYDLVIIDVPLLFETNLDKICDKTIGVIAKRETCIERIIKRDNIDKNRCYCKNR